MIEFIESVLKDLGFNKLSELRWNYPEKGISIQFPSYSHEDSVIKSDDMMMNFYIPTHEVLKVLYNILEDPWEYEKHLLRDSLNKIEWIHEHYGKIFESYGLYKFPGIFKKQGDICIGQGYDNYCRISPVLRYGFKNRTNNDVIFTYNPGIESFTLWVGDDKMDILNLGEDDVEAVKKILLHIPWLSFLLGDNYSVLYRKYKDVLKQLTELTGTNVSSQLFKDIPEEWMGHIRVLCEWSNINII